MVKRRMADDRIEADFARKTVHIAQSIVDVRGTSLFSRDRQHRLGNIQRDDCAEVARKLVAEQAGATPHIKDGLFSVRQIVDEEVVLSFKRGGFIILRGESIERLRAGGRFRANDWRK